MDIQAEIAKTLFYDALHLKRKGDAFTSQSLEYLYSTLTKASCYALDCLPNARDETLRPSFYENKTLKKLPYNPLFLTVAKTHAALLRENPDIGLELYIFHFDEKFNRWLWPFIGMGYGFEPEQTRLIAVLAIKNLQAMPKHAHNAMVEEIAKQVPNILCALQGIWEGRYQPTLVKNQTKKTEKKPTIRPSSFDQQKRTRHKKRGATKGRGSRSF